MTPQRANSPVCSLICAESERLIIVPSRFLRETSGMCLVLDETYEIIDIDIETLKLFRGVTFKLYTWHCLL